MSDLDEIPQGKQGTIQERLQKLDRLLQFRPVKGFVCRGCSKFFESEEEDGSPPIGCPICDDEDKQQ